MQNLIDEAVTLDFVINDLIHQMSRVEGDSEEFAQMADQLKKLYSLKEIEQRKRISPDTLATIAANLLGIILIVGHERMNVVTSKALNFIMKLR